MWAACDRKGGVNFVKELLTFRAIWQRFGWTRGGGAGV